MHPETKALDVEFYRRIEIDGPDGDVVKAVSAGQALHFSVSPMCGRAYDRCVARF